MRWSKSGPPPFFLPLMNMGFVPPMSSFASAPAPSAGSSWEPSSASDWLPLLTPLKWSRRFISEAVRGAGGKPPQRRRDGCQQATAGEKCATPRLSIWRRPLFASLLQLAVAEEEG